MAKSNSRSGTSKNNNPTGRNQYSGGLMDAVRERPIAAAAAAAGAAAAGLFLWSKRAEISGQLSNLSDQIGEWTEGMRGEDGFIGRTLGNGEDKSSSGRSQSEIAEEALTLKSTGKKSRRPADPMVAEQDSAGAVA